MTQRFYSHSTDAHRPLANALSENGRSGPASSGAAILLIDDNPDVGRAIGIALTMAGHRLDVASGPEEAFSRLARSRYDAILLDMNFSVGATRGDEGLVCLDRIVAHDPAACIVVLTAHSGIRIAVAAMKAGARDFVMKPWRNADLVAKIDAAILRRPGAAVKAAGASAGSAPVILLGESAAMQRVRELVRRVGPTSASVVVTGPSGSGRTLAARAIHAASRDAAGPIVRIDLQDGDALYRLADAQGTAILRHPDRLDRLAQEKLLDRLPGDLRCIAVADGIGALVPALRRRIATIEIAIPPLVERGDDAVSLARHFARVAAESFGRPPAELTQAAEAGLRGAAWPDEVRGLALAIERAVLLAEDGLIDLAALGSPHVAAIVPAATPEAGFALSDAERAMVETALRAHRHNVTKAAAALGLSRGALYRRMARYGL